MNDVILFFGTLSLENNGSFAAVRTKPEIIGQPRLDGLDGLQGPEPLEPVLVDFEHDRLLQKRLVHRKFTRVRPAAPFSTAVNARWLGYPYR